MEEPTIISEKIGKIGLITMNRPRALNALNQEMLSSLVRTAQMMDVDEDINVVLLRGSEKAFAAGADIRFMAQMSSVEMQQAGFIELFEEIGKLKKPIIASVSGFALGGGFEVALACDMILASDTAIFGLPEVTIGVIPGGGGTQRLTRTIGKQLAMEMILNDRKLTALEAEKFGLVNHVYPVAELEAKAMEFAEQLSERAPLALIAAKSAILAVDQLPIDGGLQNERNGFVTLFDTSDQKEGMKAFLEKRKPNWRGA